MKLLIEICASNKRMNQINTLLSFLLLAFTQSGHAGEYAAKHTVLADGHPIAVFEKSIEDPKGVILLHHGRTWSSLPDFDLQVEGEHLSLMDGFNESGFSVWAMDARGYGATPRDNTGWNTPNRAAQDLSIVLQWLSEKSGEKVHVWGWSMGSMISQLTAQQYPTHFASLTLFGYPAKNGFRYRDDFRNDEPPRKPTTAKAAASDFITPGSISQKAIDEYVRHSLKADPVRMDWRQQHEYNQLDASKLSMPVLLIHGEFDPLADEEAHGVLFTRLPNAHKQWVVLKGGDHAALLETSRKRLLQASVNFFEWIEQ